MTWTRRMRIGYAVTVKSLLVSAVLHAHAFAQAVEYEVHEIPLPEQWQDPSFEYSGLSWFGDHLVLLPQYPERTGYRVPMVARSELHRFVQGGLSGPVSVETLALDSSVLAKRLVGYEGLESIAFHGGYAFLTVETEIADRPSGYVVRAEALGDEIRIEMDTLRPLFVQTSQGNLAYEAIVVNEVGVQVLYELNGGPNRHPRVLSFDFDLRWRGTPALAHPIEYRITDASSPLADGSFFVMNYHWPGDGWQSNPCLLKKRFGQGRTHSRSDAVERILHMQARPDDGRFFADQEAPLQLRLASGDARNWEGLEILQGVGFVVLSDEHPRTIFGFVKAPDRARSTGTFTKVR